MTTIIVISIGILLASMAALMSIHYGGEAFNGGEVKVKAVVLENAAQNVATAMAGRRFGRMRAMPVSLDDLRSGGDGSSWLQDLPDIDTSGGGPAMLRRDGDTTLYVVLSIPDAVCRKVNRDYLGGDVPTPAVRGSMPRGCFGTADEGFVFYSVLGRGATV